MGWQLPWCVLLAVVLLVRKVSVLLRRARESDPPKFFSKESQAEDNLSLREQGKQGIKKAVNMQMSLIRFARNCNLGPEARADEPHYLVARPAVVVDRRPVVTRGCDVLVDFLLYAHMGAPPHGHASCRLGLGLLCAFATNLAREDYRLRAPGQRPEGQTSRSRAHRRDGKGSLATHPGP